MIFLKKKSSPISLLNHMAMNHIHGISIFLCIFRSIILVTSSSSESEALLKLKESFTNAPSLDSWKPEKEPCVGWVGVLCENGLVSGLRLAKMGLSGKIDVDALTHLSGLRSVVFKLNAFSGPIPHFYKLGALRGLDISDNQFSGEIPSDFFSRMKGLRKVWLSGNNFSGRVPSSLAQLSQLMDLRLEKNKFSGAIPSFEQVRLISINVSNNNLEGEIPSGLSRFSGDVFEGNPGLCGGNSGRACDPSKVPPKISYKNKSSLIIFWILLAFAILLSMIVCVVCVMRHRRRIMMMTRGDERVQQDMNGRVASSSSSKKKDVSCTHKGLGSGKNRVGPSRANDLVVINDEKGLFGMNDLLKAAAEVLGNGALGLSFKATMDSGLTVVVKRVKEMNKIERNEFDLEITRLGSLKHQNVLPPLAYYYRKEEKLIVHEYQHKGSLLFLLHGDRRISPQELNWPVRLNIIQGIARGLHFLHTELSSIQLPHGDLKSSNVLLSENYEPLLSDFGYCSFINESQARHSQLAYKSPESILYNQISPKCDVYFLGIIILEILTRKFPSQYLQNEQGGTDLVQWVRSAIAERREAELLDPNITSTTEFMQQMILFLHIGVACTEDQPNKRLSITQVITRIDDVVGVSGCDSLNEISTSPELQNHNTLSIKTENSIDQQSGNKTTYN